MSTTAAPLHQAGADAGHSPISALAAERARLERVVAELAAVVPTECTADEDLGEIGAASQHPADVASETLEREVDLGLLEEFRIALAEVRHAVARVADGSYGTCARCACSVPAERLRAVPATRWCLPCAEAVEREQRWASPMEHRRTAVLRDAEFLPRDDELGAEIRVEASSEEAAVTVRRVVVVE